MHLACLLFSLILQSFATSNPGLICLLRFSGKAPRQPLLCPAFQVRWNRGKSICKPFSFPPVFWDQFALLPLNQGLGRHTGTTSCHPQEHCRAKREVEPRKWKHLRAFQLLFSHLDSLYLVALTFSRVSKC